MSSSLHPPNVQPGDRFADRNALREAGVHLPPQTGIDLAGGPISRSIVLNGGYEDDHDEGSVIIYTGQGGNHAGKQVADQEWTRGNIGLRRAKDHGTPVWVTRGPKLRDTPLPTGSDYVYGGAYRVMEAERVKGSHGFFVCLFRLELIDAVGDWDPPQPSQSAATPTTPKRVTAQVQRIVRDTTVVRQVKALHRHQCQVCGVTILHADGRCYSEGAHIQPLGGPSGGPDVLENILCLCPNDHVRFDYGAIYLDDALTVHDRRTGTSSPLRCVPGHDIGLAYVSAHRKIHQIEH